MSTCLSYDNRETCGNTLPSSCVPYTGYLSGGLFPDAPCRPNVNDVLKRIQDVIDAVQAGLGDNTTLNVGCLSTINPLLASQKTINQVIITQLCSLKTSVEELQASVVDPDTILLAVDLLCLLDPSCDPAESYTLTDIIIKLVTAYCSLLTRVTAIETALNM